MSVPPAGALHGAFGGGVEISVVGGDEEALVADPVTAA